jgi:DNA-binding NtrC family response regulator
MSVNPSGAELTPPRNLETIASEETGIIRPEGGMRIHPLRAFKSQVEKEYIESVLRRTNWNISAAARLLEIQRSYLHQKIADLGIERPEGE